ncbi:hypothetical protein FZW96_08035 [Bacillus sp. BGMRC 2118]|nr:hypothetical protein FZW96_08035 [Bacillus sp. BGMRC 2118]
MSTRIYLNLDGIPSANNLAKARTNELQDASNRLGSLGRSLDYRVKSRSNVDERINTLCHNLDSLASKLDRIRRNVDSLSKEYEDTENYLNKKGLRYSKNLSDRYEAHLALDPFKLIAARNAIQDLISEFSNSDNILRYKGMQFRVINNGADLFLKIVNKEMRSNNSWQYNEYRHKLMTLFNGDPSENFKRRYVNRMINGAGIPLYVKGYGVIEQNMRLYDKLPTVSQFVRNYGNKPYQRVLNGYGSSFVEGMRVWDDFDWRNTTTLSKFGKGLGAAGTLLTVGDNFIESFRNNGEWDFSSGKKEFAVNVGVDLAWGAGAMATGAALGSLVAPPLGTAVGILVGVGANFAVNYKWGEPPQSIVDRTKDVVNDVIFNTGDTIKNGMDAIGDVAGSVGKKLDKIFW